MMPNWARGLIWGCSGLYLAILFTWLLLWRLTGDRIPQVALVNMLAVYLFALLPLVFLSAWVLRAKSLAALGGLAALAYLALFGGLWLPRPAVSPTDAPTLRVMTFNVLAWHEFTEPISAVIRAEDPDVLLLQELTFEMAAALETDLGAAYPYRVLDPAPNPNGIGVFSKLPLQTGDAPFGSGWIGGPQLLRLTWQGQQVALVNFHMRPTTSIGSMAGVARTFRTREEQARLLVDYAASTGLPVILGGDGNHTPLSTAHAIFTATLTDAWQARGFGLGHTFPDSTLPGSDRPHWGDVYVPPWLARIDYLYTTSDWEIVSAHTAQVSGVSDHRGVVALLRLRPAP